MAWAFAKLEYRHEPCLDAIAAAAMASMTKFTPQGLSSTVWAFASLCFAHAPLLAASALQAIATLGGGGPRSGPLWSPAELANTAWSFAKLLFFDVPLLDAIASASIPQIPNFTAERDLAILAWAFAALELRHQPLLDSISAAVMRTMADFRPLGLMNISWAFAVLSERHLPLMKALSPQALRRIGAFTPQNLSVTAWAFATLRISDAPLFSAISRLALATMSEFSMHHLAKLAWASAVMSYTPDEVGPLLPCVLETADRRLHQISAPAAHSLLWALWASDHPQPVGEVFLGWLRQGVDLRDMASAVAVLLLDAEWRRDTEERLWLALLGPSCRGGAPQQVICKFAARADIPEWVQVNEEPWDVQKVQRNNPELGKYLQSYAALEKWVQPTASNHWDKLSAVISFIDDRLSRHHAPEVPGAALQLLSLLETFAQSREHWLKVAGGAKAEVLEHAFGMRRWSAHEVAVECGTFVGYSAARLAVQMWRHGGGPAGARVMTIEVDPMHACIARHFLDLAGLSSIVEVSIGQVHDVLPKAVESFGERSLGLVFMDYKGSIFHTDLELLEQTHALAPSSIEVADNVALPGAPLLLWRLAFSPAWQLQAYAMMEFFEPNTEDWMAVAEYVGPPGAAPPPAPASWHRLSWHTDHMRRRAGGLRPTEGDMFEEDRVAYSRHVRRHYLAAGIQAQPWRGPVDAPT